MKNLQNIFKKLFHPKLILIVLFFVLVGIEAYLLYYKVYANLSTSVDTIVFDNNIVRVDVKSYTETLELLDLRKIYQAPNLIINNPYD